MKRIGIIFMAALLFFAAPTSKAARPDRLDEILSNMQRKGSDLKTFYAEMNQETLRVDLGGRPERYSASIFFSHGKTDRALISYTRPRGQKVWVLGDNITLYQPALSQAIKTTRRNQAAKNPEVSFVATPYSSVPQLKSQYTIVYLGDEGGTAKLQLTPKTRSSVSKAILWVDQSLWLPVKYQVTSGNGNTISTITLSNVGLNGKIAEANFKVELPEGTKIVKQ